MNPHSPLAHALPALQPVDPAPRLALFVFRQMAAHGLNDAAAAHALINAFGKDFRRPLTLMRALVGELSACAASPIAIGPWCCPRMTAAEAALMRALACIEREPERARLLIADLLGRRGADGPAATAHAVAVAFADLGLPLD